MTPLLTIGTGLFLIIILVLAISTWRLAVSRRMLNESFHLMFEQVRAESEVQAAQLSAIREVMDHFSGGITKRISESIEVATAVGLNAPDVFKDSPTLLYSLYANDQFHMELYRAAGHPADNSHQAFCQEQKQLRHETFVSVFEKAGLTPPLMP